jgi:hypothetical protein
MRIRWKLVAPWALLAALILTAGCSDPYPNFKQEGYFKKDGVRLFIISMTDIPESDEVLRYARRLMHTEGRMTRAYFYAYGVPWGHQVTMAPSFDRALNVVLAQGLQGHVWLYQYNRGIDGETFRDWRDR